MYGALNKLNFFWHFLKGGGGDDLLMSSSVVTNSFNNHRKKLSNHISVQFKEL